MGQQQRVEIMKALYRNADIVILDEPTAVLTPQEAAELFEILKTLTREGISIIFITHKLNEVLEIADRITVLRRGKKVETIPREGATEAGLARAMVGREVLLRVDKRPGEPGEALLKVEDLSVRDDRGLEAVRGVSFDVRAGEIVGVAGRRRQRPERADRRPDRSAQARRRSDQRRRSRPDPCVGAPGARRGHGSHSRGPAAARPRPRVQPRREPRAARLRQAAVLAVRLAEPAALAPVGRRTAQGVRRPRWRAGDTRRLVVRRQPAEGRHRAGGLTRPERPGRGAADSRPRRRRDRVRAPPARRAAGRRQSGAARLARARGDPVALRPDPRDLRRTHRRRVPAGRQRRGARDRDDRRRTRGGAAA